MINLEKECLNLRTLFEDICGKRSTLHNLLVFYENGDRSAIAQMRSFKGSSDAERALEELLAPITAIEADEFIYSSVRNVGNDSIKAFSVLYVSENRSDDQLRMYPYLQDDLGLCWWVRLGGPESEQIEPEGSAYNKIRHLIDTNPEPPAPLEQMKKDLRNLGHFIITGPDWTEDMMEQEEHIRKYVETKVRSRR